MAIYRTVKNIPTFTWVTKPAASTFVGEIRVSDVGIGGSSWYSNGVSWSALAPVTILQTSKGFIVPALAAANAATYIQTGTSIAVTSTAHTMTAVHNGKSVYLAIASGLATAGWYTNFQYVDANSFTCVSSISQSTSGTVNTNLVETVITPLTTSLLGGLMGANGELDVALGATYTNSANAKTFRAYFGGSIYLNYAPTTTATLWIPTKTIQNANSESVQFFGINAMIVGGVTAGAMVKGAINTANAVPLTFSVINSTANEFIVVETIRSMVKSAA